MPGPVKRPEVSYEAADRYFAALQGGDRDGAIAVALSELDGGVSTEKVLLHLLVPAQLEVGQRWQDGGWSVAQEHLATSCSEAVLTAVTTRVHSPRPTLGKVVVACVEEEWHTLPSRLFAELLALRGWQPSFLGAAIPTDSLASFLLNAEPNAVALSCSVAMNLTGAAACIDAAHSLKIPVIVGGRGFGNDDRRARHLGADAWASGLDDACSVLSRWSLKKTALASRVPGSGEDVPLAVGRGQIAALALAQLKETFPAVAALERDRARRLEQDVVIHLRFIEAALLADDPDVYLDFVTWDTWLAPGVAPVDGLTAATVDAIAAVAPSLLVATASLLGEARARLASARVRSPRPSLSSRKKKGIRAP
jgi:methanogenic corrinoid protein MtbC1